LQVQGLKIGGILTELSAELDRVRYVVLGIGLNVNQQAEDLPPELRATATSLRLASGRVCERAELAVAILRALDTGYARLRRGDFGSLAEEWESACTTIGREVTIRAGDRRLRGRAESLDPDGALLVRSEYGHLEPVTGRGCNGGRIGRACYSCSTSATPTHMRAWVVPGALCVN
jgi:BirA family transcriptional regulator, biotin operon repressor / biotin---[acetyl-CoA-carboxylase] ligase